MNKVQRPSAVFFSDERPSRKSLLSSASCITGGNQLLWTMSALMLSACGGGGGGSSPSSSDTTIPAGNRNSLRPVSSATDFTIQVGQAPRRHITSLNDQTTDAQTAQDHATGSQTTDSQDSSEQRQVEGQNVNNNGDTPSAPTGPNRDTPQTPNTDSAGSETDSAGTAPSAPTGSNTDTPQTPDTDSAGSETDSAGSETDSAGGGTAPSAPTGTNTDTPQVPADTTPPATPRLSLVDTGTDASDGTTCNNQIAVSGLEDGASVEYSTDGGTTWTPGTSGTGASGTSSSFTVDDGTYADGDIQVRQTDAAGNTSQPVQLGPVSVDTTAPSLMMTAPDFGSDGVLNGTEASQPLTINGTSSGVEDGQTVTIILAGPSYIATVSGNSWSTVIPVIDLQALAEGNHTITANVSDAAGNLAPEATHQFSSDTIAPLLTITDNKPDAPTNAVVTYSFTFSEDIGNFDADDITVTGGIKGAFGTIDAKTYTLIVTPNADSTDPITVTVDSNKYTDVAGNAGDSDNTASQAVDTMAPLLTITDNKPDATTNAVVTYTFAFSENVQNFVSDDITVTGGIKGAFTKTGAQTYTLSVSASSNDDIMMMHVSVAGDSYRDAYHNTGKDAGSSQILTGSSISEALIGAAGDDEISGNGGADILIGGGGNDRIIINQSNITFLENGLTINGGSDGWIASRPATDKAGDVLALDGEGLNLDLTKIKQNSIQDIEIIDLTGNGDNILALNIHDVIDITNDNNIVRVSGESGDKVVSAGWRDTGTDKVVDGITYDVFKDSSDATLAELWVDQDIDVAGITADIL